MNREREMSQESKDSFVTAEGDENSAAASPVVISKSVTINHVDYDMSPAVVCIDCSMDVAVTPREFLLGQRAISASQIAREGKNVRVVSHVRQDVEKSFKEMYVDITGKLPAFARAVLPQLMIYMENAVDFPLNTASLVCVKPKALRGTCAFSETILTEPNGMPSFSMKVPTHLGVPHERRKVDHRENWKMVGKDSYNAKCTVHKRFLLDVGSEGFFFRNLRSFMIRKFIDAFIDMVREVELCVRGWHDGTNVPFDTSVCCQGGISPGPKFWPKEGESLKKRVEGLLDELKNSASKGDALSPSMPPRKGRERKSSSVFMGLE